MIKYIGKCLLIEEKGKNILVVGDIHLGMEESLNKSGVFISRMMFNEVLSDFGKIIDKVGRVDKIILLGDVKHEFGEINRQEWSDVMKLFEFLQDRCDKLIIIKGNHDIMLKGIAKQQDIEIKDYYVFERYCFLHGDKDFDVIWSGKIKTLIMGHVHPAVILKEEVGVKSEKYKCFLSGIFKGKEIVIVPSFIEFNEGSDPRDCAYKLAWKFDYDKFRVRVVGEDLDVLDFGLLKNLN